VIKKLQPHDTTLKPHDATIKCYHAAPICNARKLPALLHKKSAMIKKFFNMIPNSNKACIFIYGDIGDYEGKAEDIVTELLEIQKQYHQVEVHINSNGGEVYSGIAIVNALKNSTADISIYVDGIAASIASVIALCGKPLYMSQYSRMMIHSIKVGVYGDKEDLRITIEEIESLENTLCDLIAGKMKKTPEEVKAIYFDGKDHWITASEALALGLIEGIYDVEALPEDSTTEQIYKIFNNRLDIQSQNLQAMNIDEFKKRPSFVNVANDADILRIVDGLETEAAKVPALNARIQVFENKEAEAATAAIEALLDTAIAEERIKQPQRAHFQALLKADPETAKALLDSLTPKKRVMNVLNTTPETAVSAWDTQMDNIRKKNGIN
jgi:ATP-dependent Clp endopeptidase proteolytic subunit ClpP